MHITATISDNITSNINTNLNSASIPSTSSTNNKWSGWLENRAISEPLPVHDHGFQMKSTCANKDDQVTNYHVNPAHLLTDNTSQSQLPSSSSSINNYLNLQQHVSSDLTPQCCDLNRISTSAQTIPISDSWSSITTSNSEVIIFY